MGALKRCLTGAICSVLMGNAFAATQVDEFATYMADKHGFDPAFISQTLKKADKNQAILEAIARPWEAKPWHQYHPIFLTDKRTQRGADFWQEHQQNLARAEQETGVPAEIIVAIIGVETFYGQYKGKYPVLDALYTLGFYYPPRAKFFKKELEEFFLLAREQDFVMEEPKGSYAGAMGWGQFISSSYRHYAVDFDGDKRVDLLNNPVDAIGSVANYFVKHGWQKGQPVAFPVTDVPANAGDLLSKSLKYSHSWQELSEAGVKIGNAAEVAPDAAAKLFAFAQPEGKDYWLGLKNFYVITRYNHSPLYAMAVYQLSQDIKAEFESR